jgi:Lipase (class 3)
VSVADASYALLCLAAEDAGATTSAPPAPAGCQLLGVLTAVDALIRVGPIVLLPERVFYGWVLRRNTEVIAVLRGTEDLVEWGEDADAVPIAHLASGGHVEAGFYGIFSTLQLALNGDIVDPVQGLSSLASSVTVTGHSLGAPLALYLGANLDGHSQVTGKFFASPRPGDGTFANWAASRMASYASYRYAPDLVPEVPRGLGYALLPETEVLPANPRVTGGPAGAHHCYSYAWLLDPSLPINVPDAKGFILP